MSEMDKEIPHTDNSPSLTSGKENENIPMPTAVKTEVVNEEKGSENFVPLNLGDQENESADQFYASFFNDNESLVNQLECDVMPGIENKFSLLGNNEITHNLITSASDVPNLFELKDEEIVDELPNGENAINVSNDNSIKEENTTNVKENESLTQIGNDFIHNLISNEKRPELNDIDSNVDIDNGNIDMSVEDTVIMDSDVRVNDNKIHLDTTEKDNKENINGYIQNTTQKTSNIIDPKILSTEDDSIIKSKTLINEEVIKEVICLMGKIHSLNEQKIKESEISPNDTTKTKEKKKKKKKSKKRENKDEVIISEDISPKEPPNRVILKRGNTWKDKNDLDHKSLTDKMIEKHDKSSSDCERNIKSVIEKDAPESNGLNKEEISLQTIKNDDILSEEIATLIIHDISVSQISQELDDDNLIPSTITGTDMDKLNSCPLPEECNSVMNKDMSCKANEIAVEEDNIVSLEMKEHVEPSLDSCSSSIVEVKFNEINHNPNSVKCDIAIVNESQEKDGKHYAGNSPDIMGSDLKNILDNYINDGSNNISNNTTVESNNPNTEELDSNFTPARLSENIEPTPTYKSKKQRKKHSNKVKSKTKENIISDTYNTQIDNHKVSEYFENGGEILYDEDCKCSVDIMKDSLIMKNQSNNSISSNKSNVGVVEQLQFHKMSNGDESAVVASESFDIINDISPYICGNVVDDTDSDNADTWHHKNIKEKIEKLIGARLKSPNQRNNDSNNISASENTKKEHTLSNTSYCHPESQDLVKNQNDISTKTQKDEIDLSIYTNELENNTLQLLEEEEKLGDVSETMTSKPKSLKHLSFTYITDSDENNPPATHYATNYHQDLEEIRLVERWESLQSKAEERHRQSTQLRQLQRQVKTLRLSMEGVITQCTSFAHPHALDDPSQIGQKIDEMKSLQDQTENLRSDLSSLNVMVHRFTSEVGASFVPLKDEMAELYRLWDEMHRRVNSELNRLQSAEATWRLWEEQKSELTNALKQDSDTLKVIRAAIDNGKLTDTVTASVHDVAMLLNERRKGPNLTKSKPISTDSLNEKDVSNTRLCVSMEGREDRLSDSGTSGYESCSSDDLSERERRLVYLRRLARELEGSLVPGSKAWNEINKTLTEAENELHDLQDNCRSLLVRTAETLDHPNSKQNRFSPNTLKRRNWSRDGKSPRSPRLERRSSKSGSSSSVGASLSRREWIWRVVRAAMPFQAALLLLFCVACLLEPNCCDSVNTFNFSFRPQFRYSHGSPPI